MPSKRAVGYAVGYARVSTLEQATEGASMTTQAHAIATYAAMRDLTVLERIDDGGVSGGTPIGMREGGARLLALVASGTVSAVIAYKLDRLFRDCADCLTVVGQWRDRGISLHLVDHNGQTVDTSSSTGWLFLTMMSGFAEFERNRIGEVVTANLATLKSEGVRLGSVRLGERRSEARDGKGRGKRLAAGGYHVIEPDHEGLRSVARALELHAEGFTAKESAEILTAEGAKTARGGPWHKTTVQRIIAHHRAKENAA